MTDPIEKARRNTLDAINRDVDARSRAMAAQVARVLEQLARIEGRQWSRLLFTVGPRAALARVEKRNDDELVAGLEEELLRILRAYGLQQLESAGRDAAASVGGDWVMRPDAVTSFMRTKEVRLQRILRETREEVRNSVRDVIATALEQDRQPSTGAIARRIRNTFHGREGAGGEVVRVRNESGDVLPTARYTTDEGTLYAFSSERAALIARTELAQAENTGIVEGYRVSGVQQIEWLAYRDGNSGKRRHDRMHGKRAPIDGHFTNPTTGAQLRYPGDPEAPISETANCRCTTAAVRRT